MPHTGPYFLLHVFNFGFDETLVEQGGITLKARKQSASKANLMVANCNVNVATEIVQLSKNEKVLEIAHLAALIITFNEGSHLCLRLMFSKN